MINIEIQQDSAKLKGQIAAIYELFIKQENLQGAQRAKDLALKLSNREYSIAFCGHFSAGKSSMINELIGEKILPSSPIPTSANLVKIKSGEDYAKVFFKEGKPLLYPAPYDFETVKSHCKDGDQIHSIEISYSKTSIPKNTVIMDTPGIDSTDDAHRIATESALHLADIIFYVMDYNHVQSELNFLFTKELTEAGKEIYLVINQIDKHREEELTFTSFQAGVRESFSSWGVKPEKIFYTSLKSPEHNHNQFQELQQFIHEKIGNRFQILPESIFHSLKKLGDEHRTFLAQRDEEKIKELQAKLNELSEDEAKRLPETTAEISERLETLLQSFQQEEKELYDEIELILDNAYVMPFQTRDLAQSYLEARQPDFKMGLFFAKQKTEQERQQRLNKFYDDLTEKVTSQIEWHVKELMLKRLKENGIENPSLMKELQHFKVDFDQELLINTVKTGARLTGDYVLNYTKDVTTAIKRITKEKLRPCQTGYLELLKEKQNGEQQQLEAKFSRLSVYLKVHQELADLDEKKTLIRIGLEQIFSGHFDSEKYQPLAEKLASAEIEEAEIVFSEQLEKKSAEEKSVKKRFAREGVQTNRGEVSQVDGLIPVLRSAASQVKGIPGFKKISQDLEQKAERLKNQSFTVALFGAFSAGKSSFANALLGERLLPVSPNPTTAAINKIMPIDESHPHGTVLVKLKSQQHIMEDVNRSLAAFDMAAGTLDEAVSSAKKAIGNHTHDDYFEKTHLAFLQAFVRGIEPYRKGLGNTITADLEAFTGFVANEEQSCLVEWIEVYYDCELTRKGITLVDTPGADSINARHTGVAFEYIKNSDAILFVTYYNHAFSKADREFLIQLGRVKDTFALDKMFFMVNAIDLAHDEEEMQDVLDYVEDQLVSYGIRHPHLYPVSSLQGLQEKLTGQLTPSSGIGLFEERFYDFIDHDLREIAVESAQSELQRIISQLHSFIVSAQSDQETKEIKRIGLEKEKEQIMAYVQKQSSEFLQSKVEQESDELVFYIKQRVFLRFNDFLKEAFNPSLLKDDGRNLKKALQTALDEFLADFGYDFAQEMRATTLRLEAHINKLLTETERSIISSLQEHNNELSFSAFEMKKLDSIDFDIAFAQIDKQRFKTALSYFKHPKSFFEKNDRKKLGDELESNLQQPADDYLSAGKERLKHHYTKQMESVFAKMLANLTIQAEEYYQGALASLSNEISIEELKKIQHNLVSDTEKGQIA